MTLWLDTGLGELKSALLMGVQRSIGGVQSDVMFTLAPKSGGPLQDEA